jgi:hypothetical protein
MKQVKDEVFIDAVAEPGDAVEVELQHEVGLPGRYKLYVHVNGQTVLRMCKISHEDNTIRFLPLHVENSVIRSGVRVMPGADPGWVVIACEEDHFYAMRQCFDIGYEGHPDNWPYGVHAEDVANAFDAYLQLQADNDPPSEPNLAEAEEE